MKTQNDFKDLYLKSLSQFDHSKTDLLDVMGIEQKRADFIKDKLVEMLDSKSWVGMDSEMLQEALYETEPKSVSEILLLGYMIGILKTIDSNTDDCCDYEYKNNKPIY